MRELVVGEVRLDEVQEHERGPLARPGRAAAHSSKRSATTRAALVGLLEAEPVEQAVDEAEAEAGAALLAAASVSCQAKPRVRPRPSLIHAFAVKQKVS